MHLLVSLTLVLLVAPSMAGATSELFTQWWAKNKDEYATHGIWVDNVSDVLEGGKLRPAELVLRETGVVSSEHGWFGDRKKRALDKRQIETFAREHPLPPVCDGIAYVRIVKQGHGYLVERKRPGGHWETLRSYEGEMRPLESRYAGIATRCDRFLLEAIRAPDATIPALEIPIPYCPRFNQNLSNFEPTTEYVSAFVPYPGCYVGVFEKDENYPARLSQSPEFLSTLEIYEAFAKEIGIDSYALSLMVDEANGRRVDSHLMAEIEAYNAAFRQFEESGKVVKSLKRLADLGDEYTREFWKTIRATSFVSANASERGRPQRTISFAYKSTAGYGDTVVAIGRDSVAKFIDLEWIEKLDLGSTKEVQTRFSSLEGFTIVNLHDANVLIIGPKSQIERFKPNYPNMVFKEDLSPEELKGFNGTYK